MSGPLATLPGTSRIRLPSASQSCCDRTTVQVSHLHSINKRLTAHFGHAAHHLESVVLVEGDAVDAALVPSEILPVLLVTPFDQLGALPQLAQNSSDSG